MNDAKTDLSPDELEFRKKISSHSFGAKVWGGLAGASFFGALMSLTGALVATAAAVGTPANPMLAAQMALLGPLPMAVLAGLAVFGVFATYMAQRDETEATALQTKNQAQQNAKCLSNGKASTQEPSVQYEQNCRSDNKKWVDVVRQDQVNASGRAI